MDDETFKLVSNAMRDSLRGGEDLGMEMAAKALREYQSDVAVENQTWNSAIAVIEMLRAKLSARATGETK